MINLPLGIKVYVFTKPLDMRRAIDGMASLVQAWNKERIQSGHLFVFFSKKCDRIKVLYWDRNGFALWLKRLEKGRFRLPRIREEVYKLTGTELNLLLEGIDLLECAKQSAKLTIGENPIYVKVNHQRRTEHCTVRGNGYSEANVRGILGHNASEGIEFRNTMDIIEADVFPVTEGGMKDDIKVSHQSLYRDRRPWHDMKWKLGELGRSSMFLKVVC
jgi:transposase